MITSSFLRFRGLLSAEPNQPEVPRKVEGKRAKEVGQNLLESWLLLLLVAVVVVVMMMMMMMMIMHSSFRFILWFSFHALSLSRSHEDVHMESYRYQISARQFLKLMRFFKLCSVVGCVSKFFPPNQAEKCLHFW